MAPNVTSAEQKRQVDLEKLYPETVLNSVAEFLESIDINPKLLVPNMLFSLLMAPEVSATLDGSKKMESQVEDRYKITSDFLFSLPLNPRSAESQHLINVIREKHESYGVDPDSTAFQYVTYCFTAKMVDMLRMYDTTPPTPDQEEAWYQVWRGVCTQLGNTNLPEDYQQFRSQSMRYEKEIRTDVSEDTRKFIGKIYKSIQEFFPKYFPKNLKKFVAKVFSALLDEDLAKLLDFTEVSEQGRQKVQKTLKAQSVLVNLSKRFKDSI